MDFETEDMLSSVERLSGDEKEQFLKWINRSNWKLYKRNKRIALAQREAENGVSDEEENQG